MNLRSWLTVLTGGLFCLTLSIPVARASDIIPPPWQSVVAYAGFVGVVECTVAGGVVARYRVIDSWKGPKNGSELLIGRRVDVFGFYYPLSLVGERYLIAADPACGYVSLPPPPSLDWGFVPAWWRRIPPDLFADWYASKVPFHGERSRGILDLRVPPSRSLEEFKAEVLSFLDRDEKALELETLRASARLDHWRARGMADSTLPPCDTPACLATQSDSLERVVSALLELSRSRGGMAQVLWDGGGRETLRQLDQLGEDTNVLPHGWLGSIRTKIRCRLRLGAPEPQAARYADLTEDRKTRQRLHKVLEAGVEPGKPRGGFEEAFIRLTRDDPNSVATFLARATFRDSSFGCVLGSYFASQCHGDRARYLRMLLQAIDPFVRVSGAVYLTFEAPEDGERALRSLTSLGGDPGAWAALTLARRGHKGFLPRALEVFSGHGAHAGATWSRSVLQARVIELLSNSAAASGLHFPPAWNPQDDPYRETLPLFIACSTWWGENGPRITLRDPWLDILAPKRID